MTHFLRQTVISLVALGWAFIIYPYDSNTQIPGFPVYKAEEFPTEDICKAQRMAYLNARFKGALPDEPTQLLAAGPCWKQYNTVQ